MAVMPPLGVADSTQVTLSMPAISAPGMTASALAAAPCPPSPAFKEAHSIVTTAEQEALELASRYSRAPSPADLLYTNIAETCVERKRALAEATSRVTAAPPPPPPPRRKASPADLLYINITEAKASPADLLYTNITEACVERKRALAGTDACAAVRRQYRHSEKYCTGHPYTDLSFLLSAGILPPPPQPPREKIEECRAKRYLLWTRNTLDFFAGHQHKWFSLSCALFSLSCALWEAHRLGRTLVLDSFTGIDKTHIGGEYHADVPFTAWYNSNAMAGLPQGGLFWHEFVQGCGAPGILQEGSGDVAVGTGDVAVVPPSASHADMLAHAGVPLLVREWDASALRRSATTTASLTDSSGRPDMRGSVTTTMPPSLTDSSGRPDVRYGYQVCHRPDVPSARWPKVVSEPGVDYSMPEGLKSRPYADWVYSTTRAMLDDLKAEGAALGAQVVCVHVRRGDMVRAPGMRARYPSLDRDTFAEAISICKHGAWYPSLDRDTSAEAILATLAPRVPQGTILYIATNERDPAAYFAPLAARYAVRALGDYVDLAAPPGRLLLPSSLALFDYAMLTRCPAVIPTFASEAASGGFEGLSLSPLTK
ncbi:hypothetical protein JKP88DRAFT_289202 [Tribonema minus]|uniref:Uncharacterized protein n=1 Tax=Tribonema minus TaxID=303371 RepID=A0A836CHA1_9STRA|nr:hypothetical protein JKP88DRAFT_289202 [Tribonema minus]